MAETRYARVARDLAQRIAAGEYAVGGVLPTELQLSAQYGVSRHTMRAAIEQLQQSGLVSRRKKAGTRVEAAVPHTQYRQTLGSLHDLMQFGAAHVREVQRIEEVVLDRARAQELDCPPGSRWLEIASLRRDAAKPIAWTTVYVDAARFDVAELASHVRVAPEQLVSRLLEAHYGVRITQVHQTVAGVLIPPQLAGILQVAPNEAGLRITRRYLDGDNQLVTLSESVHPASRYTLSMRLHRDPGSADGLSAGLAAPAAQ